MIFAAELALLVSLGLLMYAYLGYPVLLMTIAAIKQMSTDLRFVLRSDSRRARHLAAERLPSVAIIIAAHNEQLHIARRIQNVLDCDYPKDRLHIYVGSDGSSDDTNRILAAIESEVLRFMPFAANRGKPSVVNDLVAAAEEDILVLTDANTYFSADAIKCLVRHFEDPAVGCVCGELRLANPMGGGGENPDGIYWRYERVLKFFEGRLGALLGANGGIYAVRRTLYRSIPANTIVDDFRVSVDIIERGFQCRYEPEARADEEVPPTIQDEFRRRVRIGMGNYQALVAHRFLLNPARGYVALAFVSHKLLRWFAPHLMIVAFFSNAVIVMQSVWYAGLMASQIAFYGLATAGYALDRRGRVPAILRLPWFFVSMNIALLVGFVRFLRGNLSGTWIRSAR